MKQLLKNPRVNFAIAILCLLVYLCSDIVIMQAASERDAKTTSMIVCITIEIATVFLLLTMSRQKNPVLGTLLCIGLAITGIVYSVKLSLVYKTPDEKGIFLLGCIFLSCTVLVMCIVLWIALMAAPKAFGFGGLGPVLNTFFWGSAILYVVLHFLFTMQLMETISAQREWYLTYMEELRAGVPFSVPDNPPSPPDIIISSIKGVQYTKPLGFSEKITSLERWASILQYIKPFALFMVFLGIKNWCINSNRRDL